VLYIISERFFKKFQETAIKSLQYRHRKGTTHVKLSFDVSVSLLCGLYNTFTREKFIIELEMDTVVLNKDFWYDLRKRN